MNSYPRISGVVKVVVMGVRAVVKGVVVVGVVVVVGGSCRW